MTEDLEYGRMDWDEAARLLRKSKRARDWFVSKYGDRLATQFVDGKLPSENEEDMLSWLEDEINCEGETVWIGEQGDPDGEDMGQPILKLTEYDGLFRLRDIEGNDLGYFRTEDSALNYAYLNYDYLQEND